MAIYNLYAFHKGGISMNTNVVYTTMLNLLLRGVSREVRLNINQRNTGNPIIQYDPPADHNQKTGGSTRIVLISNNQGGPGAPRAPFTAGYVTFFVHVPRSGQVFSLGQSSLYPSTSGIPAVHSDTRPACGLSG